MEEERGQEVMENDQSSSDSQIVEVQLLDENIQEEPEQPSDVKYIVNIDLLQFVWKPMIYCGPINFVNGLNKEDLSNQSDISGVNIPNDSSNNV